MKKTYSFIILGIFMAFSCTGKNQMPRSKHVILIGLDGVSSYGFQKAATPRMNELAQNGALSVNARCILESSSSQNWMTMLSGAIPNQHGVTSNDWEPQKHQIEPILKNKAGFFPSVFDLIKTQKPEDKVYLFYEWGGLARMFDLSVPDKVERVENGVQLLNKGIDAFFADKPEFLFVAVDEPDHVGHAAGHESQAYFDCITKYDSIIGRLVDRLKAEKMLDKTVLIITADHGGIHNGHGGDTPNEMEIPILLYGGKVTKGKLIEHSNMIADIAPTVAGLLGVTMPDECVGKFIHAAFERKSDARYLPMPLVMPSAGSFKDSVEVHIRTDFPGAKIFYTIDGSVPSTSSLPYTKPFVLKQSCQLKAISFVTGKGSRITEGTFKFGSVSTESTKKNKN